MKTAFQDLQRIPGVGKRIAQDLLELDVHSVEQLQGQDPQELYERLCELQQCKVDRCMLYVFRCAVYFAEKAEHDSDATDELLKWWNWKD